MRKSIIVALVALLLLAACSPPAAEHAAAPAARAMAVGEVAFIDKAAGAVTIRHEAIPAYNMGAMTMEFTTDTPDILKDVAVGDHVAFELSGPTEIDKITVTGKK